MKKSILIVVLLLVVIFGVYYFVKQNEIKDLVISTQQNNSLTKELSKDNIREVRIGDLVFDLLKDIKVEENQNSLTIEVIGKYIEKSQINDSQTNFPILILYNQEYNEKSLELQDWFNENGPQTGKTSASSFFDKEKKIGNIYYLESFYKAPSQMYRSEYYDVVIDYFKDKKDIYTIVSYRNPNNPEKSLTPEEQKSIENYEKIVNQIIQSIRFVE
jgi:hypothetical protein